MNLEEIKSRPIAAGYHNKEERDWLIAEVERLREAIKDLNALRRNDQKLTEKAEAQIKRLKIVHQKMVDDDISLHGIAERSTERAKARVKEMEEALRECCRMFEWCDTRYGQLLEGKD